MHAALMFILCWSLAFISLAAAIVLLNIYYGLVGNDLTLRPLGQEAVIAGISSLIEGAGAWIIISVLPAAGRALAVPAILVAILYKFTHLEDWNRYDVGLLLLFQIVVVCSCGLLFLGRFEAALVVVAVFGGFLALVGSVVRSL
jgi:hypothetical protein